MSNGDAKESLDFIDIHKQQVYGVKVDGAEYPEWKDTALKNYYFAQAGLFVQRSKFGDEDEVGAFTLLADTLMSKSPKLKHVYDQNVCTVLGMTHEERPVTWQRSKAVV